VFIEHKHDFLYILKNRVELKNMKAKKGKIITYKQVPKTTSKLKSLGLDMTSILNVQI
jgi:hypothetical protein